MTQQEQIDELARAAQTIALRTRLAAAEKRVEMLKATLGSIVAPPFGTPTSVARDMARVALAVAEENST